MKKFLTAILVVVMIASMASVAAFAADPTFEIGNIEVVKGATEVVVPVQIKNIEGGITSARVYLEADPALTPVKGDLGDAQFHSNPMWSPLTVTPLTFSFTDSLKDITEDGVLCKMTYSIPADAEVGDSWNIKLTYKQNDTFNVNMEDIPFTCVDGTITVVDEIPTETETEPAPTETETEPAPTGTQAPATDDGTKAPATDDATKAPATDATTKAPVANNGGSAQTGDMVFVVLAVMVVALGAAIVVKKVNVK